MNSTRNHSLMNSSFCFFKLYAGKNSWLLLAIHLHSKTNLASIRLCVVQFVSLQNYCSIHWTNNQVSLWRTSDLDNTSLEFILSALTQSFQPSGSVQHRAFRPFPECTVFEIMMWELQWKIWKQWTSVFRTSCVFSLIFVCAVKGIILFYLYVNNEYKKKNSL